MFGIQKYVNMLEMRISLNAATVCLTIWAVSYCRPLVLILAGIALRFNLAVPSRRAQALAVTGFHSASPIDSPAPTVFWILLLSPGSSSSHI